MDVMVAQKTDKAQKSASVADGVSTLFIYPHIYFSVHVEGFLLQIPPALHLRYFSGIFGQRWAGRS